MKIETIDGKPRAAIRLSDNETLDMTLVAKTTCLSVTANDAYFDAAECKQLAAILLHFAETGELRGGDDDE